VQGGAGSARALAFPSVGLFSVDARVQQGAWGSSVLLPHCFPKIGISELKLDNRTIGKLTRPHGKADHIEWDDDLTGFGFRLRAADHGRKTRRSWIAQYRAKGRTRRVLIGSAETLTAEQARAQAKKILAQVALGNDPQAAKQAARLKGAHTLRSVAEDYLAARKAELRQASYRVTALYLTGAAYFGPLHTIAIGEITRADIAARLRTIAKASGTVTASRARSALSTLFVWAMGEGLVEANPTIGTNRPADSTPRDRVLSDAEIAAIWTEAGDDDYGKIVRLLLLTGARRQEIGGLRWSELDLDKGLWVLPKERAKNGRALLLPLPQMALDIITTVPERVGRDHLFGERAASGFTHWGLSKSGFDKRLAGKVAEWKLHDLRRTAATRMADLGVQPHVIEAVLNHYGGFRSGVSGTYNRSPYEREMRAALALWADHVHNTVEGGTPKVVPLRRAVDNYCAP
jgi:integrase